MSDYTEFIVTEKKYCRKNTENNLKNNRRFLRKTHNITLVIYFSTILLIARFIWMQPIREDEDVLIDPLLYHIRPEYEGFDDNHQSCKMPLLTPGSADIYDLDHQQFQKEGRGRVPPCLGDSSTMFAIDYESNLIRLQEQPNDVKCYYRSLQRNQTNRDITYLPSPEVIEITQKSTKLTQDVENINVWCKKFDLRSQSQKIIYKDYIGHVPVKPEVEISLEGLPASKNPENYPSVLIFGMDSLSHMNFRRYMPQSHDFLVNEMKAVEFNGFNSLGDTTRTSLFPLLSGLDFTELNDLCHRNMVDYFDLCLFMWKEFQDLGYRTSYAEDCQVSGVFTAGPYPGFAQQPTHYDFRTLTHKLSGLETKQGHYKDTFGCGNGCYGSKLSFDLMLENLVRTARTFSKLNKPVFHFSWTADLTHDLNYYSRFGEPYLLKALKELHFNNLLKNSVLILVSDHGMRSGALRLKTRQGFLEERLPMLYIVLPESMKKKYPNAYENMKENTDKLTTAFDLHATMKDLTNLANLEPQRLVQREIEGNRKKRSVSLFEKISENRTCDVIGFPMIYCACMSRTNISVEDPFIQDAAKSIVESINHNLTDFPNCDRLLFEGVTTAFRLNAGLSVKKESVRHSSKEIEDSENTALNGNDGFMYEVGFETSPGNGSFYASIFLNSKGKKRDFKILDVTRISAYGSDGDCMSVRKLKPFCHCRK